MNIAQHILVFGIRIYRAVLSPALAAIFGPLARCRFEPSCSCYAREAVEKHGAAKGSFLAAKRLCRCHPFGGCGHDPVPESDAWRLTNGETITSPVTRQSSHFKKIFSHGS